MGGETTKTASKIKVAIIVDVRGWALDHIANDLVRWFGDCEFDIDVISWHEELRGVPMRQVKERLSAYDVLWPFCLYEAIHIRPLGLPPLVPFYFLARLL